MYSTTNTSVSGQHRNQDRNQWHNKVIQKSGIALQNAWNLFNFDLNPD